MSWVKGQVESRSLPFTFLIIIYLPFELNLNGILDNNYNCFSATPIMHYSLLSCRLPTFCGDKEANSSTMKLRFALRFRNRKFNLDEILLKVCEITFLLHHWQWDVHCRQSLVRCPWIMSKTNRAKEREQRGFVGNAYHSDPDTISRKI